MKTRIHQIVFPYLALTLGLPAFWYLQFRRCTRAGSIDCIFLYHEGHSTTPRDHGSGCDSRRNGTHRATITKAPGPGSERERLGSSCACDCHTAGLNIRNLDRPDRLRVKSGIVALCGQHASMVPGSSVRRKERTRIRGYHDCAVAELDTIWIAQYPDDINTRENWKC